MKPSVIPALMVFLEPKDDVTSVQFHEYWAGDHAQIFSNINIVKQNIRRYQQVHGNTTTTAALNLPVGSPSYRSGWAVIEADAIEKVSDVFSDPEYLAVVVPDEFLFINRSIATVLPAKVYTFINKDAEKIPDEVRQKVAGQDTQQPEVHEEL